MFDEKLSFATEASTKPSSNSLGRCFESRRRPLYPNGPWVSPVGFGSYRVGYSKHHCYPLCEEALDQALDQGLNLIDTSSNYGDGESEQLIGNVLSQRIQKGSLKREEVVVVTKAGYVQGSNMALLKIYEQENKGFSNVYQFNEDLWYSMDPEFLEDQLKRSLQRLKLDCVDVFLLHNPEYVLKFFQVGQRPLVEAHADFYAQIQRVFEKLESLVARGLIKSYGVSSNNFGAPESEYSVISLPKIHQIALSISSEHHFKVIQMPMNWLEVSPLFYEIENSGESHLSYAQKNGIGVLLNRPFNAMLDNGLIRLTRPQPQEEPLTEGMRRGFENWSRLAKDLENMGHQCLEDMPGYDGATLSQMVISSLVWLPGVSSVLCGMRKPQYVLDIEGSLRLPSLPYARNLIQNIYENLEFHRD